VYAPDSIADAEIRVVTRELLESVGGPDDG